METYLKELDTQLFFFVNQQLANVVLDWLCPLLRNKFTWIPFYIAAAVFLFIKYKIKALWFIAAAAVTVLLTDQLSASLIKPFFERLRPCNEPAISAQVRLLVKCGRGFSFVSSHAANHFGIAALFAVYFKNKYLYILLFAWASSIAFSQVYVGVHYPFDVLIGSVLGAAIGCLAAYGLRLMLVRTILNFEDDSNLRK
jgi:membrane-associated phospholipid phosphatase